MSDFVSLKDLFGSPEFQEKVRLGKLEKDEERNGYTPAVWEKAMRNMDAKTFPEHYFEDTRGFRKDNGFSTHKNEGQDHSVVSLVKNVRINWVFELEWRLVYCPTCHKPIHKIGTLLNKVENLSYSRYFVKNGKDVVEVDRQPKPTQNQEEQLEPALVFDGQVPQSLAEVLEGGERK